jgi:hypothetical protein
LRGSCVGCGDGTENERHPGDQTLHHKTSPLVEF